MESKSILYYLTAIMAWVGAVLLHLAYNGYESAPSSSRGFILLFPLFAVPVFLGILIHLGLAMAKQWSLLGVGARIYGGFGALALLLSWLRFTPHF